MARRSSARGLLAIESKSLARAAALCQATCMATTKRSKERAEPAASRSDRVRAVRVRLAQLGITQRELASRCGVNESSISRWLAGGTVGFTTRDALSRELKMTPDEVRALDRRRYGAA